MKLAKLEFIDRMRGLAILMVIALHFTQVFTSTELRQAALAGQLGVQMVFLVSAFTLCLSADQRAAEPHPLRNFALRRLFRIAPLYYLGIVGYTTLYLAVGRAHYYTPGNILANFALIHGLVPSANNTIVPGGWTIGAEVLFYCFFPWLYVRVERDWRAHGKAALARMLGGAVLAAAAWALGARAYTGAWIANNSFGYCFLVTQLPVLALGMAYYLGAWRGEGFSPRAARDWGGFAGFFALCCVILVRPIVPLYTALPALAGIAFVFLANLLRAGGKGGGWLWRPISAIGRASYSVYILHFVVVWEVNGPLVRALIARGFDQRLFALPLYLATVALVYAAARITMRLVENPAAGLAAKIIARADKSAEMRMIHG